VLNTVTSGTNMLNGDNFSRLLVNGLVPISSISIAKSGRLKASYTTPKDPAP
jgi:hypothetical protein